MRPITPSASPWLRALCAALACAAPAVHADPIDFQPLHPGVFAAGGGSSATFYQIDGSWHGSTVLFDPATGNYGSGVPIGTLPWGTGIWGQADWEAVQQAAAGQGGPQAPVIVNQWTSIVASINYANAVYNNLYSATWGDATLVPFFSPTGAPAEQENWTAHFSGYIRVTQAGAYDFSVLNDDGFFLTLTGESGATQSIGRDYLNPRERNGFGDDLLLSPGLYGVELGMWNRLEAGVVDLRWLTPGSSTWMLVPTTDLLPVPEPATAALWLAGLGLLVTFGARRRSAA